MMTSTIGRIEQHAASCDERVSPGMPAAFTKACQPGDGIWQGDLGLEVVAGVPQGYIKIESPTEADRQLVPGASAGSKHCLDSVRGVTLYRPSDWSEESLQGPCFVLTRTRKVLHPTHGAVTIPAGFTILCRYQREWDKEEKRARRSCD
jgi:hypothetical protein